MNGPRWLYLHGFASSPESAKARAIAEHYAKKGVDVERLDLRQPSFERLLLSAMMAHVEAAIGGARDRVVVFGSSLGGLTACRVAEKDPRVCALVLLAPAFGLAQRWRARVGEAAWKERGWLEVDDHANKRPARLHFGWAEDMLRIDQGLPDVRIPTLIVHGTRDDIVDIQLSRDFAREKRHIRLVEVDDGHELVSSLGLVTEEADAHLAGFLR